MKEWFTLEEFERAGINGRDVTIKYKGKEHASFYFGGKFYFGDGSTSCYMSECVTGVKL